MIHQLKKEGRCVTGEVMPGDTPVLSSTQITLSRMEERASDTFYAIVKECRPVPRLAESQNPQNIKIAK